MEIKVTPRIIGVSIVTALVIVLLLVLNHERAQQQPPTPPPPKQIVKISPVVPTPAKLDLPNINRFHTLKDIASFQEKLNNACLSNPKNTLPLPVSNRFDKPVSTCQMLVDYIQLVKSAQADQIESAKLFATQLAKNSADNDAIVIKIEKGSDDNEVLSASTLAEENEAAEAAAEKAKPNTDSNTTTDSTKQDTAKISSVIESHPVKKAAWLIQLGSFKNKANAERLTHTLRAKGYPVFTYETKKNKQTCVCVGPELQKPDAVTLAKKIAHDMKMQVILLTRAPSSKL